MSVLLPVADKLAKLVPRLATNHDGEVVNTVRAIGLTLVAAGLDWHDLAEAISTPPTRRPLCCDPNQVRPKERREPTLGEMVDWLVALGHQVLNDREREFVGDMADLIQRQYRRPTPRQAEWLRALNARLERCWA